MISDKTRKIILTLFQRGKTRSDIKLMVRNLCSPASMDRIINFRNENKPTKRRLERRTVIDARMSARVIYGLVTPILHSVRELARKENVGKSSVLRFYKKKGIKAYKLQDRPLLVVRDKRRRKDVLEDSAAPTRAIQFPAWFFLTNRTLLLENISIDKTNVYMEKTSL